MFDFLMACHGLFLFQIFGDIAFAPTLRRIDDGHARTLLRQPNMATTVFEGSSADNIELAKQFWKAIDPVSDIRSSLEHLNISQKLSAAPEPKLSMASIDRTLYMAFTIWIEVLYLHFCNSLPVIATFVF